jgi:DNA-binding XRE family transcriptional regulator
MYLNMLWVRYIDVCYQMLCVSRNWYLTHLTDIKCYDILFVVTRFEVMQMTVRQYRLKLKWSQSELARRAGLTYQTISRIENGEPAFDYTLAAIAEALSNALGQTITIDDLEGANIIGRN